MRHLQRFFLVFFASGLLMSASPVEAQVTTATLVGQLRDTSGAVIPGATIVATHEGTGVAREAVTDVKGEFVLSALPSGPYTVKIELTGFKTMENRGMQLGAGQTVRQTFALQVGTLAARTRNSTPATFSPRRHSRSARSISTAAHSAGPCFATRRSSSPPTRATGRTCS